MNKRIMDIEYEIGYTFKNKQLIAQALTHSSYANELKLSDYQDYERLEFLGDAILELTVSDYLYHEHKDYSEGELTKMRAQIVCETSLARCARDMKINEYLRLGRGEEGTGGRTRNSILADVLEAIICAVYLDGGSQEAVALVHRFILSKVDVICKDVFIKDNKSLLQELVQSDPNAQLRYNLVSEDGPDHSKIFVVEALLNDTRIGIGEGASKKQASQNAAGYGLQYLAKINSSH